jgi:hypothetical protein
MSRHWKSAVAARPEEVRQFKAALDEANIGHAMLSDIIEVMDAGWQGAVEAMLRPTVMWCCWKIRSKRAKPGVWAKNCASATCGAGAQQPAARAQPAEVIRFSANAPDWLYQQLNKVSRVENAQAGAAVDGDWITRDGYFRERRGARHIGVAAHEFAFGEGARQSRLLALRDELKQLNVRILADEERLVASTREAAGLAEYLGGMDAIRQLDSRAEEFAALAARLDSLQAQQQDWARNWPKPAPPRMRQTSVTAMPGWSTTASASANRKACRVTTASVRKWKTAAVSCAACWPNCASGPSACPPMRRR